MIGIGILVMIDWFLLSEMLIGLATNSHVIRVLCLLPEIVLCYIVITLKVCIISKVRNFIFKVQRTPLNILGLCLMMLYQHESISKIGSYLFNNHNVD